MYVLPQVVQDLENTSVMLLPILPSSLTLSITLPPFPFHALVGDLLSPSVSTICLGECQA